MKLPVAKKPWASLGATAAVCAVVALWAACPPAFAQVTPARHGTAVPPSTASSTGNSRGKQAPALFSQVQMLQQQNRELLGQVEQLQHQLEQLKEISKEQYIALNTRINRLEGKSAPASASSSSGGGQPAPASTPAAASEPASAGSASVAHGSSAPANASTVAAANEQKAYSTAFDALRAGNFVTSASEFRAFTQTYPHAKLTPNAWYWLGESYYITQNYQQALKAFGQVLQRFPDSSKAPGALLKKGYSQYALKQVDTAQATLKSVIAKYPGSSVAKLAKQRLQDIQLQQQLH